MNFSKAIAGITILGVFCVCAINSRDKEILKKELRVMRNTLKRMKTQISDMRELIDAAKNDDGIEFTAAFKMRSEDEEVTAINAGEPFDECSEFYIVREYNGVIGVFDDCDELVKTIDRSIASFGAPDRQSLILGIRAETEGEVMKIVESFK